MLELGIKVTLAFWLGSVHGSLLIARLYRGVDIRDVGSGNTGATNALRAYGKLGGLAVLVVDAGKGVLAVAILPKLDIPGIGIDPELSYGLVLYSVALATVLGHVFPIWSEFRGGKGGATAAGLLCWLAPATAVPVIVLWALIIYVTGYVGLATMSAAVGATVYIGVTRLPGDVGLFAFACLTTALIVATHRGNIRRMLAGTESRFRHPSTSK
jgi:glycerol-3-phosphate acyltransferase PlsY